MQLKMSKIISGIFALFITVFVVYMVLTIPKIEQLILKDTEVTIRVGQTVEVVRDVYPDPSFLRLRVKSGDIKIVKAESDKFSITGVSEGTTIISYYDKKEKIGEIVVTVINP